MKARMRIVGVLALVLCIAAASFAGCANNQQPAAPQMPTEAAAPQGGNDQPQAPAGAEAAGDAGTIKLGLISTITGDNSLNGEYALHGFQLAVDEINAAGGILGKQIVTAIGDEMSTAEGSVNGFVKLVSEPDLMAICGSHMSVYAIACMEEITKAKMPYVSNGSSSKVDLEKNPYVWQSRPLDIYQGIAMAQAADEILGMKNPAILYSTDSTYVSLMEKTREAFEERGISVPDKNLFAFAETETNFSNYIAQIMNGGFDGVVEISGQNPCILIMQQAEAAGLSIPCIGSNSVGDTSTLDAAGTSANGWFSISDWVPSVNTERGAKFTSDFQAKYGNAPATSGAYAYDAVYMIKAACEAAGTTEDREAINAGFEKIKDLVGAAGKYSYFAENHSLASGIFLSEIVDGKAVCKETITFR